MFYIEFSDSPVEGLIKTDSSTDISTSCETPTNLVPKQNNSWIFNIYTKLLKFFIPLIIIGAGIEM